MPEPLLPEPDPATPPTLPPAPPPGPGGRHHLPVGGGYQLLRLLGRGSFGEVWLAEAPGGVEVAVKLITRSLKEQATQRELNILKQIKQLRHQNLLGLQAFFPLQDRLVIVLEFADGGSLADRLEDCRKAGMEGIPPAELLAYFREAAEALDYVHGHRLQHRDIKPENLLLLGRHVKVADFGLARMLERGILETASQAGTMLYRAPEVWNGKLSIHSDQYSLAVTYACLRLGRPPFHYELLEQLIYAIFQGKPDLDPLDDAEQQVLLKAMAKKPEERHANCREFVQALEAALAALPARVVNSIGMEFVLIPAGKFKMGSPESDKDAYDDEKPQHEVEITQPFYLGKYEVTVGQFKRFVQEAPYQTEAEKDGEGGWGYNADTGTFEGCKAKYTWKNPGWTQSDEHPAVNVTWNDAVAFCEWLSKKEGRKYALPTEAQWEYSCRAGTTTRYSSGDDEDSLQGVANIADQSFKEKHADASWAKSWRDGYPFTSPVGKFRPNAFGLCDMHGNVWEWCADVFDANYYKNSPLRDPPGPAGNAGAFRVIRGGSFGFPPRNCRAASRYWYVPAVRLVFLGFRVVRVR